MTYKTLLVAVDATPDSDGRLGLACDLAAGMGAHLIGACGIAISVPPVDEAYTGGAMVGEAWTLFRDMAEADLRAVLKAFHERTERRREGTEWRGRIGLPADVIAHEARAADLVVLGRKSSGAPLAAVDPADVLLAIGRPVLIVPPNPVRDPAGWPAVLAWKDTREAQRVAASALPLLRHASRVHVVEFCDEAAGEAAQARLADVVAWLARHGIPAEAEVATPGPTTVAEDILAFAEARCAGLIVAGGYGHARLREWALGGVTEALLANASVAVLLSH